LLSSSLIKVSFVDDIRPIDQLSIESLLVFASFVASRQNYGLPLRIKGKQTAIHTPTDFGRHGVESIIQ